MPATDQTHSPTAEEVMAYLDGEGTAATRASIERHLAMCPTCQAVAADIRGVSTHLAAWTPEDAPESLQPPRRSSARVISAPFTWRPARILMTVTGAAAAALCIVFYQVDAGLRHERLMKHETVVDELTPAAINGGLAKTQPMAAAPAAARAPQTVRTATLRILVTEFDGMRSAVESVIGQTGGFVDHMTVTGDPGAARTLTATLRVPGDKIDDARARLRTLGHVVEDTLGSEDVTDQIVDLDARLANARAMETRLMDLLKNRTGKLSDVLEVERELARVRLEIEQLDAQKTNIGRRVSYAAIDVTISEERKSSFDPLPLPTRLRLAAQDGLARAMETVADTTLFALRAGPTLLLWLIVLLPIARISLRRFRPRASE